MIGIYKFENKINHNIYVGQSVDIERRYKDHINRAKNNHQGNSEFNSVLHQAIRKYGIENFTFEIIEECSKDLLNEREKYWIQYYNSYNNGYNSTSGGDNQEATIKFNEDFIQIIKNLLLNSNLTYQEIHQKYNISLGRISEINTGKIWKDDNLSYPLRKKKNSIISYCIDCGKQITDTRYNRCSQCASKARIIPLDKMPVTRNELKKLIRTIPFTQIGKQFQVSDNAIKKWCDKFNLPRTKKEINKLTDEEWAKI